MKAIGSIVVVMLILLASWQAQMQVVELDPVTFMVPPDAQCERNRSCESRRNYENWTTCCFCLTETTMGCDDRGASGCGST